MKKLHVFTLGLSILALGVLASCSSKSKDTPTPPPSPSPQPQVEYLQKKVVTELFEDMQSFKQTTIYDATGRVVEEYRADEENDGSFVVYSKTKFTYNPAGKLVKRVYINTQGNKETGGNEYTYDNAGQLQKEESYGFDNNGRIILNQWVYTWENGKKVSMDNKTRFDSRLIPAYTIKYSYENGYEHQDKYYANVPNSYAERNSFRYDAQGRVLEELTVIRQAITDPNDYTRILRYEDVTINEKVYTYNDRGDILKLIETSTPVGRSEIHTRTQEYTYLAPDAKGNPTKYQLKETLDPNKDRVQTREVTVEYTYAKQ